MNGNNNFGGAAIILALGLGIALMIFAAQPRARGAELVTAAVTHQAVITNNATGSHHSWLRKTWGSALACETAIGNAQAVLDALANPDPAVKVPDWVDGMDKEFADSLDKLLFYVIQNTGKMPDFSITCELKGDPV